MAIDLSKPILGSLDSNDDLNLHNYFVEVENYKVLMQKDLFIVVGSKGTGKSAIKNNIIQSRKKIKKQTIIIDEAMGFSLSSIETNSSAEIKLKMKAYLKTIVLSHLREDLSVEDKLTREMDRLLGKKPYLKQVLEGITVNAGVVNFAVSELFPRGKSDKMKNLLGKDVNEMIMNCINDDLWLLVDDLDSIFTSDNDDKSLNFIEGLIYATSDFCNKEFKKKLWIVLFLKTEIYEELIRKASELDKRMTYFWQLSWNTESLVSILSERIRWADKISKEEKDWKIWKHLFGLNLKDDIFNLQIYITERLMNGPRDMLLLVDLARKIAFSKSKKKITLEDIQESEAEYGDIKLRQITSSFQRIYPDIDRVIDRLFRGKKQIYSRNDIEKMINDNLISDKNAREDFKDLKWLRTCTPYLFIEILYKIGVIGYKDISKKDYVFSLQKSNPDKRSFRYAFFKVHEGLSSYLELV